MQVWVTLKMVVMRPHELPSRPQEHCIAIMSLTNPAYEIMDTCLFGDRGTKKRKIEENKTIRVISDIITYPF